MVEKFGKLNPVEWVKYFGRPDKGAPMTILIFCVLIFIFLPNDIMGISTQILKQITLVMGFCAFCGIIISFFQKRSEKKRKKLEAQEKQEKIFYTISDCSRAEKDMLFKFLQEDATTIKVSHSQGGELMSLAAKFKALKWFYNPIDDNFQVCITQGFFEILQAFDEVTKN